MCRHGLPLALALTLLVTGCQNPWRGIAKRSADPVGLEQPDSLTDFPSASAEYPDSAPDPVPEEPITLAGGEELVVRPDRRQLESILDQAGAILREATGKEGSQRTDLLVRAKQMYARVLEQDSANAEANHRLGVIADLEQDYTGAEQYYLRALRQAPHNPDLLSDLGYSYQLQNRPGRSEVYLRRALEISPNHKRAANNLGKVLAENGDYDAAYAMFRRAGSKEHAQRAMDWFFPDGHPGVARKKPSPAEADSHSANEIAGMFEPIRPDELSNSGQPQSGQPSALPGDVELDAARDRVLIADEELRKQFDLLEPAAGPSRVQVPAPATTIENTNTKPGPNSDNAGADITAARPALSQAGTNSVSPTAGKAEVAPIRQLPVAVPYPPAQPPVIAAEDTKPVETKPTDTKPRDVSASTTNSAARPNPDTADSEAPVKAVPVSGPTPWPGLQQLKGQTSQLPPVDPDPGSGLPQYEPIQDPVEAVYPDSTDPDRNRLPVIKPGVRTGPNGSP